MRKLKNRDYNGKKVFVGIDVHKKTYAVAATCEGVLVKSWSMKTSQVTLLSQLRIFFEGAEIFTAYEAGFSGFALHRFLEKNGVKSIVVNAGSIAAERDLCSDIERGRQAELEPWEAGRCGEAAVDRQSNKNEAALLRDRGE